MVNHPNFYESIAEAKMRLEHTVVLYDNEPYYVLCVENHKPDGIFRVYLDPLKELWHSNHSVPYQWYDEPDMSRGKKMDQYLADTNNCTILRKHINSPLFKRFRPFPLGFVNDPLNKVAVFTERSPARHTQQGLTDAMIFTKGISLTESKPALGPKIAWYSDGVRDMIVGDYPSLQECFENLKNPEVVNQSSAFHRNFALVRGPLDTLFLAYKENVVGIFQGDSYKNVALPSKKYGYLKEAVQDLGVFETVTTY